MQIRFNGKLLNLNTDMSVAGFLTGKGINLSGVVVEYNYEILNRENWNKTVLKDGDNLEVLKLVGGG